MSTASEVEVRAAAAVADRFVELSEIQRQIADSADGWASAVLDHPEAVALLARIRSTAESQHEALELSHRAEGRMAGRGGVGSPTGPVSASRALSRAAEVIVAAALRCEVAYQAARLAYDVEACDMLESMLTELSALVRDARRALPPVVARELRDGAITCVCRCPMCSIGACGCIRATLVTSEEAWGGEEPSDPPGLCLLTPPRPGSQLADAGLAEGDRILTVDREPVATNGEMQAALRRHDVGGEARLEIERTGGGKIQVTIRRVG
jgi:PDZ domain